MTFIRHGNSKKKIKGEFFLKVSYDYGGFGEQEWWDSKSGNLEIWLYVGMIPANDETEQKFLTVIGQSREEYSSAFSGGVIWPIQIRINVTGPSTVKWKYDEKQDENGEYDHPPVNIEEIQNSLNPTGFIEVEKAELDEAYFSTRESALKFKRYLIGVLSRDWTKEELDLDKDMIVYPAGLRIQQDFNSSILGLDLYSKVVDSVKKLSLNKLYKEE